MSAPTPEQVDLIMETAYEFDAEFEIREGYSGRGMYGDEVTAIFSDDSPDEWLFVVIGVLIGREQLPAEAARWFHRSDDLGIGWVRY